MVFMPWEFLEGLTACTLVKLCLLWFDSDNTDEAGTVDGFCLLWEFALDLLRSFMMLLWLLGRSLSAVRVCILTTWRQLFDRALILADHFSIVKALTYLKAIYFTLLKRWHLWGYQRRELLYYNRFLCECIWRSWVALHLPQRWYYFLTSDLPSMLIFALVHR